MQVLDDVGVGEPVGGTGWQVVLKFLQRLVAKVVPVDKEKDALRAAVADEPVRERAGSELLPENRTVTEATI